MRLLQAPPGQSPSLTPSQLAACRHTSLSPLPLHLQGQGVSRRKLNRTGTPASVNARKLRVSATATSEPALATSPTDANPEYDWESFSGFGLKPTDYMYIQKCESGRDWEQGQLLPYGPLELSPSAGVINYGQGVFEGMKAYRSKEGKLLLFRPQQNALRMQESAARMSMPAPSVDDFVSAVIDTVIANARWVPPAGKGSLYIRPLLIGSGAVLGLGPAPEYSFLVYCSPVGNYFSGAITLKVEEEYHRAAPGGTGAAKAIGNYSPVLKVQLEAKEQGFNDVVFLDAVNNRFIEEVSSCNIFLVKDGVVSTPELRGTILAGITRRSIMELAQELGHKVEERQVSIDDLLAADEVFCTGTAVVLSPVASVTYRGEKTEYAVSDSCLSQTLYKRLTGLQMGLIPDNMGWTVQLN